jgi:hypothetical protein
MDNVGGGVVRIVALGGGAGRSEAVGTSSNAPALSGTMPKQDATTANAMPFNFITLTMPRSGPQLP